MEKASLWKLFCVFAKMGAFTIGGGYAMLSLIEDEMTRRGWISKEDIQDIIVLAQSAPGILAVNMAIFTGHKIKGFKGSVVSAVGAVLPSLVIILLIAMFFTGFKDNPVVIKIFRGIRPVAVGLIMVPAINMARKGCKKWWQWLICLAALVTVAVLKFSPIYIIIIIIVAAVALTLAKEARSRR